MYGRVVQKHARWNVCYGNEAQEPDYEHGKGRVVSFAQVPLVNAIRKELANILGAKGEALMAELNYYYDVSKCGVW
jgi:hypothetical protein